jgi:hypothetical protein
MCHSLKGNTSIFISWLADTSWVHVSLNPWSKLMTQIQQNYLSKLVHLLSVAAEKLTAVIVAS